MCVFNVSNQGGVSLLFPMFSYRAVWWSHTSLVLQSNQIYPDRRFHHKLSIYYWRCGLLSDDEGFPTFIFFFSHWGKWSEMEIPGYVKLETSSFENYKWILLRTSHQDLFNSTWRQTKQQQLSSHSDTEMISVKGVATVITLITMCVLATHTSTGIFFPVLI